MKKILILIISSFLFTGGCAVMQSLDNRGLEESNMSLENKKVLMVVAQKGFQETEYGEPRKILEEAGAEIKVASFEKGAAVGAENLVIRADFGAEDVNPEDFNAVAFIGGSGMVSLVNDKRFVNLAKKFNDAEKIVSAICIAPMILANADLLNDKNATIHKSASEEFKNKGVNYKEEDVVVDGKFITASGPNAARGFGEALVDALK